LCTEKEAVVEWATRRRKKYVVVTVARSREEEEEERLEGRGGEGLFMARAIGRFSRGGGAWRAGGA
jgi:hypothetical protein